MPLYLDLIFKWQWEHYIIIIYLFFINIVKSQICKLFYKWKTYEKYVVSCKDRISPEQVIKVKFLPQERNESHL